MKVLVSKGTDLKNIIKGKRHDTCAWSFPDGKMESQSTRSHVLKFFFHFHRTPEESKVEMASIQLEGDVIQ
ncbi:hypothetical protein BHE74_00051150 [Ensete ventricosum]|nr:hypothetical protein BHE74_00051150 [Ensete ventricosum]